MLLIHLLSTGRLVLGAHRTRNHLFFLLRLCRPRLLSWSARSPGITARRLSAWPPASTNCTRRLFGVVSASCWLLSASKSRKSWRLLHRTSGSSQRASRHKCLCGPSTPLAWSCLCTPTSSFWSSIWAGYVCRSCAWRHGPRGMGRELWWWW